MKTNRLAVISLALAIMPCIGMRVVESLFEGYMWMGIFATFPPSPPDKLPIPINVPTLIFLYFPPPLAIIASVIALIQITKNTGAQRGKTIAWMGLALSGSCSLFFLIDTFISPPRPFAIGFKPTPGPGYTLVDETFNYSHRWNTWKDADSVVEESKGQLSIQANRANSFFVTPLLSAWGGSDYSIEHVNFLQRGNVDITFEVTVEKYAGSYAQFGAACRYQNNQNFYGFILRSDGTFIIGKTVNDSDIILSQSAFSSAIHTGKSTNKVHIICAGDQLQLAVNNIHLATVTDTALKSGIIALIGGAGDTPDAKLTFDNLVVRAP